MNGQQLLADYVFYSKYATKRDGIYETWEESIDRIYKTHKLKLNKIRKNSHETDLMIEKVKKLEKDRYFLSSQRARQFAFPDFESGILKHEAKIYNCAGTYMDRLEAFSEIMYLLLCGCGVGYSLHREYINKLPVVLEKNSEVIEHRIEDSIEGWADSIKILINSLYNGQSVHFDYNSIRKQGSLINGRFLAPGADPLKLCHENITELFKYVRNRQLTTLEVHDINCFIAESVLAGGIRRSAMISLFDRDDDLMISAKTGEWYKTSPQRSMANNSILVSHRDKLSFREIQNLFHVIKQFGEPGIIETEDYSYVNNPCVEITLHPTFYNRSGVDFCNLVEINTAKIHDRPTFLEVCEAASFVATLQSLYTDFKYLSETTRKIAEHNRNIGVSLTGILENEEFLSNKMLQEGAKKVAETNEIWSNIFMINNSKRCTTVKPSGNASCILGLYANGIHPVHDNRYIRNVRILETSEEYRVLKGTPVITENNREKILSFPIENTCKITKNSIRAIDHMLRVLRVKHFWINKGCISKQSVTNNISCTIEVKDNEWDYVLAAYYVNSHMFTGLSFFPKLGDIVYDNAPFQRILTRELEERFEELKLYIENNNIDFRKILSGNKIQEASSQVAVACNGNACELV